MFKFSIAPLRLTSISRSQLRFQSIVPVARKTSTGLSKQELEANELAAQSPNRSTTWSASQEPRIDVLLKHPSRFVQHELETQPRPYAAIDLIAKEPIKYLTHAEGHVAVCDGNRGSTLQGHPKVYINLDQPKAHTCGYCGLRYAQEEFKDLIESSAQ